MGVYIKGMEMPENCFHCRFSRWDVEGGFCDLLNEDADMRFKRHDDCPLIELPDHGDLIDRDVLKRSHCVECTLYPDRCLGEDCDWGSIYHLEHTSTVIPAERSEDE